ncbi:hypothetical protein [Phenylobacterium sp.]|uniref:hypothetical protein n=1 Tax=Phenylobacterium sp. TaxID=1871053 RepID=UPI0039835192
MTALDDLSAEERSLLSRALMAPVVEQSPISLGLCLRPCGLGLLQRAGSAAAEPAGKVRRWRSA